MLKDAPLEFPNRALVCLIDPSPVLVYQIGTHDTRVLVDVPVDMALPEATTYMAEVRLFSIFIFNFHLITCVKKIFFFG